MFNQRVVGQILYDVRRDRRPETGPTGARIEFLVRTEERRAAAYTAIDAALVIVPVATGVGDLGAALPRDSKLLRTETPLPLRIGKHHPRTVGRRIRKRALFSIEDRVQSEIGERHDQQS